ncbi:MAG: hypothetical protein ACXVCY_02515 [Pseudobdellovibrionaceae bacterium]
MEKKLFCSKNFCTFLTSIVTHFVTLSLFTLLIPLQGFSTPIVLDVKRGSVEVTETESGISVESDDGSFTFSTVVLPQNETNRSAGAICKSIQAASVLDDNKKLLGTATEISQGIFLTARHVFAGKQVAKITGNNGEELSVTEKFKKYYNLVNVNTGKPVDILIMTAEPLSEDFLVKKVLEKVSENVGSGMPWVSCQYAVRENGRAFSQFSDGDIKLSAENGDDFYLGVRTNESLNGKNSSDLTTFGSSGSSVWVQEGEQSFLVGVVSCLQYFSDSHSEGKVFFPKAISLLNVLNSNEYRIEETTLKDLKQAPQEMNFLCPFTDGKGGGGFLTQDPICRKNSLCSQKKNSNLP